MKGAIYYVAIATVIFSHVKITCYFHMWRYQVFTRKLTWYFIGVYIIKRFIHLFNNWRYSCFYLSFHSEELHTYHHCHYQPMYSTVRLQLKYLLHTPTYPAYTVNTFWYLLVRERMGQDKANVIFLP